MGHTVTSNPNNNRQPVFYNGKSYMPETTGNFSYIKVGNHIVPVDLDDPTWFQKEVHGDSSYAQNSEDKKTEGKDWLKYFQDMIAQGKKDWQEARGAQAEAAEEKYDATVMIRKIKAKHDALLASSHVKKDIELTGAQKGEADDYNEQIEQYTAERKEAGEAESQHIRKRLRADYQIHTYCREAANEILFSYYRNLSITA